MCPWVASKGLGSTSKMEKKKGKACNPLLASIVPSRGLWLPSSPMPTSFSPSLFLFLCHLSLFPSFLSPLVCTHLPSATSLFPSNLCSYCPMSGSQVKQRELEICCVEQHYKQLLYKQNMSHIYQAERIRNMSYVTVSQMITNTFALKLFYKVHQYTQRAIPSPQRP